MNEQVGQHLQNSVIILLKKITTEKAIDTTGNFDIIEALQEIGYKLNLSANPRKQGEQ